jgi:hypothetical protein
VRAALLADAEDGHDVGVVQPRRRPSLALEAPHLAGVGQGAHRQHLEGDAAAQGFLLSLVDHPHAAPPDLADDAVLPQPPARDFDAGGAGRGRRGGADVFQQHHGREQLADLFC